MERGNIDLLILIFIFIIAYYNKNYLNQVIIIIITLIKFYPITLVSIFLFLDKVRNKIFNIALFLLLISVFLFIQKNDIISIFSSLPLINRYILLV